MTRNPSDRDAIRKHGELRVDLRNIGGISDGEMSISPGVTLLSGKNASNKSSFLRGLVGVLGGPVPPVKSDADSGSVTLRTEDDEYYLDVSSRDDGRTVTDANPVSDRAELCELFVALGETNPIRRSILADGELYELLMRPVDTEEIEAEIERLEAKKDELDDRRSELDRMEDRLPTLRTRANGVREEIEDVEAALREKREAIEARETESTENDALDELKETRSEHETVRHRIRTQTEAIDSLEADLEDVLEQRNDLEPTDSSSDVDSIEDEIVGLHHQKQQLTTTINALSPIVEMNDQLLDDEKDVPDEMKSEGVVAELDPSSRSITCWTCGTTVEREAIAEQVRTVREILREKRDQREALTDRIRTLEERKQRLERRRSERERLAEKERSLEAEIEDREEKRSRLEDQRTVLREEIETLQEEAEAVDERDDELLDLYGEVSDLEYERGRLENELNEIEREIERIESELTDRDDVEEERDAVTTQLRDQRDRIETLERDLVTVFNESMQRVLDILNYENVERVWIERFAGRSDAPSDTEFELHIVRSDEDGAAYEDTIDSLSKSEREVIGLVVAFAGYLAHDVANELPIIVVDAVEMLDADRIRGLLNYFDQHAAYVVAAVLPEEAAELEEAYPTVPTSSFSAEF